MTDSLYKNSAFLVTLVLSQNKSLVAYGVVRQNMVLSEQAIDIGTASRHKCSSNARSLAFVMVYEPDLMNWGYVQTFPLILITSFHWEQSRDNLVSYANCRKCSTCPCGFPWLGKSFIVLPLSGGGPFTSLPCPFKWMFIKLGNGIASKKANIGELEPVFLDEYETLK